MNPIIEHYFVFNGKNSRDFGVWISGGGTFDAPARETELVSIPGRNGNLFIDKGRYGNINLTYPAFISRNFYHRIEGFRDFMTSQIGYKRLEDTYHPEEYRLAAYAGGLKVSTSPRNLAGSFSLEFNCQPQRFLKVGDLPVTFTANGALFNPTSFPAKPLIRAYGTGTVTIAGVSVRVTAASGYTDIDCELMDAYKGSVNCNNNIVLVNGEFPVIPPGESAVTISGFSSVEITPRWWRL